MNKKKIIIIIGSVVAALLIIGLIILFATKGKEKKEENDSKEIITITFDANGGNKIEDMEVTKGSSFNLPVPEKENSTFIGWFNEETKFTDDITNTIDKDIVLTAKWEEKNPVEVNKDSINITFDSKGGSTVSPMAVKCVDNVATITNLPKPKKDSYNFMSWEDKNGKSILNGAKLICDSDLVLYAIWEYDGPVANPNQNNVPDTPTTPQKSYKCPSGFELKDTTRCVKLASAEPSCPDGMSYSSKANKCYKWTGNPNKTCKSYNGYDGVYFDNTHGTYGCAYGSRDSYPTEQTCKNQGYTYDSAAPGNHCWVHVIRGNTNVNTTCQNGDEYKTASDLGGTQNSGCYKLQAPSKKCPEGYTNASVYGECALIQDAVYE